MLTSLRAVFILLLSKNPDFISGASSDKITRLCCDFWLCLLINVSLRVHNTACKWCPDDAIKTVCPSSAWKSDGKWGQSNTRPADQWCNLLRQRYSCFQGKNVWLSLLKSDVFLFDSFTSASCLHRLCRTIIMFPDLLFCACNFNVLLRGTTDRHSSWEDSLYSR